jgi:signal transduction histidine kinase
MEIAPAWFPMTNVMQDLMPVCETSELTEQLPALTIAPENLRAERRFIVNQRVYVTMIGTPDCRFTARVSNVSRCGMRLEVDGTFLHTGTAVKVEWGGHVLLGNIRHRAERDGGTMLGLELFSSWESFLEEILARQAEELDRNHADLQSVTGLASRDLQERLSVVLLYLDLLAKHSEKSADAESLRLIRCAQSGATRIRDLTHDLYTYSRVITEAMEYSPVNCDRVVEAAASLLAGKDGAVVTHDCLPTVMGHGRQLRMVFQNLISNGLKFNRSEQRRVHVSARYRGAEWIFSVLDNGIGIESNDVTRLFLLFERLHGDTDFPGNGLGLATSKRVVEKHGGRIWVESERGKGSIFHFTIPARPAPWE